MHSTPASRRLRDERPIAPWQDLTQHKALFFAARDALAARAALRKLAGKRPIQ